MESSDFEKVASGLTKKGFCILDNALPDSLSHELRNEFEAFYREDLKPASIGRSNQLQKNQQIRSDSIRWIDPVSEACEKWLSWSDKLRIFLNRELMLGLNDFESHFAEYAPGQFYAKHVDAFSGKSNRILSIVTYLNEHWSESWGGELVLYTPEETISIAPILGRVVIFLSEDFEHEVLKATHSRLSIAGWFRR